MTRTHSRRASIAPPLGRVALISIGLILVPLVLYPKGLGFPPLDLNPVVGLLEWAFYIAVLSLATSQMSFSTRVVAGGFTVVIRLALGAISGCFVGWTQGAPLSTTVIETMWSYPLAIIPQVLVSPVMLAPFWEALMATRPVRTASRRVTRAVPDRAFGPTIPTVRSASASRVASSSNALTHEPSFDDAVSYIGEYSGVRLCWIVDSDGLPVAVWQRQQYTADADFWAPISVEMIEFHRKRLSNGGEICQPDRLEVRTTLGRLVVESVRDLWLGVLTDPDADELIGVRISRARDMIDRHLQAQGHMVTAGEAQYV